MKQAGGLSLRNTCLRNIDLLLFNSSHHSIMVHDRCWSSTYCNRSSNLGLIADARSMHDSIILMGGKGGQVDNGKPLGVSNKKTLDSDTRYTQSARNSCWKPPIPRSCLQRNMPPLAQAWAPLKWPSCVRQCLGNSQVRWIRCHDKPRLMGVAPSNFLVYT